jgi:hypothetical protein
MTTTVSPMVLGTTTSTMCNTVSEAMCNTGHLVHKLHQQYQISCIKKLLYLKCVSLPVSHAAVY